MKRQIVILTVLILTFGLMTMAATDKTETADVNTESTVVTIISLMISVLALAAAALATIISYKVYQRAKEVTLVNVYLRLRERFDEIHDDLPPEYIKSDFCVKPDTPEWNNIRRYWFHVFDEWVITHKLNKGRFKSLWDDYYSHGIREVLDYPAMRTVIDKMRCHELFVAFHEEFVKILEELKKKE